MHTNNEQALISKKKYTNAFSVNRRLINSKMFRDKFELLPLDIGTKYVVYKEVSRLLEYVDGQENEYLVAVDYYTGKRIVDNFDRQAMPRTTGFTEDEYKLISENDADVIVIHNHSYNGRPSAMDMITFHNDDRIRLSIVACHSGELYAIFSVSDDMLAVYEYLLAVEQTIVNDIGIAKVLATNKLYDLNDRTIAKKKLFDVRRL